jgi:hypothetical protein
MREVLKKGQSLRSDDFMSEIQRRGSFPPFLW